MSCLVLSPGLAPAKEPAKGGAKPAAARTVTVIAESGAAAQPDLAVVTMYFTSYGWTVDKARLKVDRLIQNFLKKLEEKKIVPSKVQPGDAKLKPSFQFNRDLKTNVPSDFLVTRQLDVHFEDLNAVGKLMDSSLSVGSFLLESARLTLKDKSALEAKAFQNALEEARSKAEGAAKALESRVGQVLDVEEITSRTEDVNMIQATEFAMLMASNLKPSDAITDDSVSAQNGKGFLAVPEGEDPAKAGTGQVKARSKLRVTFSLE